MALSMDEQHILAEIEERLSRSEPALATQLSSFGEPVAEERPPRALVLAAFTTLILMTFVSLLLYALTPMRAMPGRSESTPPAAAPAKPPAAASTSTADASTGTGTGTAGASTPRLAPQVKPALVGLRSAVTPAR